MTWGYFLWVATLTLISLTLSLAFVSVLLVKLPSTYFLDAHCRRLWIDQHPIIRWSGVIIKNLLGILLILLGGVLSIPFVPGQGLLTILIGIMLLDFPRKRRFERAILGLPRIRTLVDRLRHRFGKTPLELD